ncbi:MAG: hypothetical protein M3131_05255 [Actinomycetota bacterium]|nr:hypothetical protein [Actinomycetota bacterium]
MISIEARRLAMRGRFSLMVGVATAFGIFNLLDSEALRFSGAFSVAGGLAFQGLAPLIAGVVSAGAVAEDRSRGFSPLVMSRGLSRGRYLAAKAAAMALAAGAATLAACVLILVAAAVLLPGGETAEEHLTGPLPALFTSQPLLNDVVAIGFLVMATAGLAISGVLVGALVPNEYIAAAVPFVLTIAATFLADGVFTLVSPYTYLELDHEYVTVLPEPLLAVASPLYWTCFALTCFGTAVAAAAWRELS